MQTGCQFYRHFHFLCNLIPITLAGSGAHFCVCFSSTDERDGSRRRRDSVGEEEGTGEGVRATCGGHVEGMLALPQLSEGW